MYGRDMTRCRTVRLSEPRDDLLQSHLIENSGTIPNQNRVREKAQRQSLIKIAIAKCDSESAGLL